jgi:hypothetical protein
MKKILMLLFSVCAIKAVNAQTKFPVTVAIGSYSQLGYKKPDINFRGGIEYHSSHITGRILAGNLIQRINLLTVT